MKSEHVTSLTLREWVGVTGLLVVLGGFMSYSALYQGFKLGQFDESQILVRPPGIEPGF